MITIVNGGYSLDKLHFGVGFETNGVIFVSYRDLARTLRRLIYI